MTSAPSSDPLLATPSLLFYSPLMKELRPGQIMSSEEWKPQLKVDTRRKHIGGHQCKLCLLVSVMSPKGLRDDFKGYCSVQRCEIMFQ